MLHCYWKHFGEIQNMALSKTIQDKRRFLDVNEDDIKGMLKPKFKKNTEKSTLTSKNILNNFLKEADIALDLENCTKDELNNALKKLYFAARKSDRDFYKITSYRSVFRHSMSYFVRKKLGHYQWQRISWG